MPLYSLKVQTLVARWKHFILTKFFVNKQASHYVRLFGGNKIWKLILWLPLAVRNEWYLPHRDKIPGQTLDGQLQPTYKTDKHQNPQCFFYDGTQQYGITAPLLAVKHYMNIINLEFRKIQLIFVLFQQYYYIMKQENQQILSQSNTIIYSTIISTTPYGLKGHHKVEQEYNSTNSLKTFFHMFCNIQKKEHFQLNLLSRHQYQ
jgi:hypothetical protein